MQYASNENSERSRRTAAVVDSDKRSQARAYQKQERQEARDPAKTEKEEEEKYAAAAQFKRYKAQLEQVLSNTHKSSGFFFLIRTPHFHHGRKEFQTI